MSQKGQRSSESEGQSQKGKGETPSSFPASEPATRVMLTISSSRDSRQKNLPANSRIVFRNLSIKRPLPPSFSSYSDLYQTAKACYFFLSSSSFSVIHLPHHPSMPKRSPELDEDDSITVLKAVIKFREQHDGDIPTLSTIAPILEDVKDNIKQKDITADQLNNKFKTLQRRYSKSVSSRGQSFIDSLLIQAWGKKRRISDGGGCSSSDKDMEEDIDMEEDDETAELYGDINSAVELAPLELAVSHVIPSGDKDSALLESGVIETTASGTGAEENATDGGEYASLPIASIEPSST